MTKRGSRK